MGNIEARDEKTKQDLDQAELETPA